VKHIVIVALAIVFAVTSGTAQLAPGQYVAMLAALYGRWELITKQP